ncbi:MAG: DUF1292 domain-containing protein [Cyanobacteriota bacterium]
MTENKIEQMNKVIKTTDEDGKIHTFKLVEIVEYANNEYGLFEYLEMPEEDMNEFETPDEEELYVMKIIQKKGEFFFEVIDDEDEFNRVMDFIEKNSDELEFE